MQDTYGKTAEQLNILMIGMVEDLSGFPLSAIQTAFRDWRRSSKKIPTIAEMLALVEKEISFQRSKKSPIKKFSDHGGTWGNYKTYLAEIGHLAPTIDAHADANQPVTQTKKIGLDWQVPWGGKMWSEFSQYDKIELQKHMIELVEKRGLEQARGYAAYLKHHANAPNNFFEELA